MYDVTILNEMPIALLYNELCLRTVTVRIVDLMRRSMDSAIRGVT